MIPPPNSGDETPKPDDDPLGGMDPMAWLESLARRQGANPDELVTGGNLELPPEQESAPETTSETTSESEAMPESVSEVQPEPERAPDVEPVAETPMPEQPQTMPEPTADLTDFTGGMDPMAWLEALAARQGAPADELVTGGTAEIPDAPPVEAMSELEAEPIDLDADFDLEPLPDDILDGTSPLAWLSGLAATEAGGAPQPAGAEGGSKEDPLDGMDPMAWLEALARGEGLPEDESLTEAMSEMPAEGVDIEAIGQQLEVESAVEIVDGSDPMAWLAGADLGEGESVELPQDTPEPSADLSEFTGGMDPMAWLEALAARQGAPADELVTGGTANISEPPAPAEPGEAPKVVEAAEAEAPAPEPEYTWEPEPQPEMSAPEPVAEAPEPETEYIWEPERETEAVEPPQGVPEPAADLTDFTGGMDPMAWLEALARRQGAPVDELVTGGTAEISEPPAPAEPGEVPEVLEAPEVAAGMAAPEPFAEAPEPETEYIWEPERETEPVKPPQGVPEPPADLTEFTGGMDPMAWLEALARRQGAPVDELVTGGTAEISEPPAPAEPGEVPEVLEAPEVAAEAAMPEPVAEVPRPVEILDAADPMAWLSSVTDEAGISLEALGLGVEPPVPAEPVEGAPALEPAAELAEFTGGEDPMRWLESLAARQGASRDELVTPADLEIPVPAADVSIDGPGYSEFDPFSVTAPGRAPGELPEGVSPPAAMNDADALAWLESLTGASQIDLSALDMAPAGTTPDAADQTMTAESALSWLESLARETPSAALESLPVQEAEAQPAAEPDMGRMAGGMSDDVDEVRAWLEAQARELEQTREQLEAEEPYVAAEMPVLSDEPAVPGELPDWLTTLRETSVEESALAESPLVDDMALPDVPSDLPQWLAEAQPSVDLESLELDEALPQAEISPEPEAISLPTFTPDELEALTRPASPDDIDSWAEALDEEYDRRQAGDESIPDWYLEAIRRAEDEWTGEAAEAGAAPATEAEPEPLIERAEIPDWLRSSMPEAPVAAAGEDLSDVPPWLIELGAGIDLPSAEAGTVPAEEVRPPWLPPPTEEYASAETPVVEPVTPAPMAAAPKPPPTPPAPPPAQRPARTLPPSRYAEVLRDARQMATAPEQVNTALDLYQALVDDSQLLEDTRDDLQVLAQQNPGQPKVHRLLGDTFMRMGDLQSALDTYLSALDQL